MIATLKSFNKSNKYEGKIVITVSTLKTCDITGLEMEIHYHYLVVNNYYYTNLIGQQVELTLVKSPKLGFDVVTNIKLVKEQ